MTKTQLLAEINRIYRDTKRIDIDFYNKRMNQKDAIQALAAQQLRILTLLNKAVQESE